MNKLLFYLSSRLFGEADLELCILRQDTCNCLQIYLLRRERNDPFWPNMLHIPGIRKIPSETDQDHLKRLVSEVGFPVNLDSIEYVMCTTIKTKRGTEYADIRRVFVPYDPEISGFYDIDDLPNDLIEHHKIIVELIRRNYD